MLKDVPMRDQKAFAAKIGMKSKRTAAAWDVWTDACESGIVIACQDRNFRSSLRKPL
jgi:hypothetical protein